MKFDTKQASAFSKSSPNTFLRNNKSIPSDRFCEDPEEGRHLRYDAALIVTPILTSARRSEGLTSAGVDELSGLMHRLQLDSSTSSSEDEDESESVESDEAEVPMLGRVECTVYDSKKRQNRQVLRSSRLLRLLDVKQLAQGCVLAGLKR